MAMKGDGPLVVGLMWMMSFLCVLFTALRVYTRTVLVKSFGMDDIVFIISCIMFIVYTTFLTVSATLGFGQNMWDVVPQSDIPRAVFFSSIGQTFAILGMAITKWSLGLFLLRLVSKTMHKVAIWLPLVFSFIVSILCVFFFWFGCAPVEALWNRMLPGARCDVLPTVPMYYLYGSTLVFTDFYFALFPWLFVWQLQMNRREKIVILCSMSLGVFAAILGILRCSQISGLSNPNFLKAAVKIILFSAAEQCVTMICIGIPVCRPLYRQYLGKLTSRGSSSYNKMYGSNRPVALRTIGGGEMRSSKRTTLMGTQDRETHAHRGEDIDSDKGPTPKPSFYGDDHPSDEEILASTHRKKSNSSDPERGVIRVTEEFEVVSSKI